MKTEEIVNENSNKGGEEETTSLWERLTADYKKEFQLTENGTPTYKGRVKLLEDLIMMLENNPVEFALYQKRIPLSYYSNHLEALRQ